MNIIELNSKEIGVVGGGGAVAVVFQATGFLIGVAYAAYKLNCGAQITIYDSNIIQPASGSVVMESMDKVVWVDHSFCVKFLVLSSFVIGGSFLAYGINSWLFGEDKPRSS